MMKRGQRDGRRGGSGGFSLVEMMVVMTVFLVVLLSVMELYVRSLKSRQRAEALLEMEQHVKLASTVLQGNLQVTGFETFREGGIIPDPACNTDPTNPYCANPGTRDKDADGFMVVVPQGDAKHFMTPAQPGVCLPPFGTGAVCPGTGCFTGSVLNVCSPTGFSDGAWTPGGGSASQLLVCGPMSVGQTCPPAGLGGFEVPAAFLPPATTLESQDFATRCGVPAGGGNSLCCVAVTVQEGPRCQGGRNPLPAGPCDTNGDTVPDNEEIVINENIPDGFFASSNARCNIVTPADVLHFQVHVIPDAGAPFGEHRVLAVRRNFARDANGQPAWMPIAEGVEELKACYYFNTWKCDAAGTGAPGPNGMGCVRWNWGGMPECTHTENKRMATIRDIERVVVQMTFRNTRPLGHTVVLPPPPGAEVATETPGLRCVPPADDPGNAMAPLNRAALATRIMSLGLVLADWRVRTVCVDVMLRNIALNQVTDWF